MLMTLRGWLFGVDEALQDVIGDVVLLDCDTND